MSIRKPGQAVNLSVNLNKVALLRNSRGATNPSPITAAKMCIDHGVAGITLHWREDNRHTTKTDVLELRALCADRKVEFNLEGDARNELVELAMDIKPTQFTLVPVSPGEITSDHGWDLPRQVDEIKPIIQRANDLGLRTAIFMDANPSLIETATLTETQRIELYTEPYAAAFGTANEEEAFNNLSESITIASDAGMGVNAGHDLNLENMVRLATDCPGLLEVSIGHALIADALYLGLEETIARYLSVCGGESVLAPATSESKID